MVFSRKALLDFRSSRDYAANRKNNDFPIIHYGLKSLPEPIFNFINGSKHFRAPNWNEKSGESVFELNKP